MRTFAPFGGHDAASMANLERKRDECAPKENREERARNTNVRQGTLKRQSGDLPFRCCERKHDDGGGAATMCNEAAVSDDYDTAWA